MNIKDIKIKMIEWSDFYGQDLVNTDEIVRAKTKKELKEILSNHIHFLEIQNIDARNYAENFIKELGLYLV